MKLDLKQIARQPGATLPFSFQMDLTQLEWNGDHPVSQPVTVEGRVRNMAGVLLLQASMATTLSLICDRCAQPFSKEKTVDFESMLATELEGWPPNRPAAAGCEEAAGRRRISALQTARGCVRAAVQT